MYKWSWVIFAKKSKFDDAGGPDTVVSPIYDLQVCFTDNMMVQGSTRHHDKTSKTSILQILDKDVLK